MTLNPMKPQEPTAAQRLGVTARRITEGVGELRDNAVMRPLQALDQAHVAAQQAAGGFVRDFGASYTAGKPVAAPPSVVRPPASLVQNPIASTVGVGGLIRPGAPSSVRAPNFAGVQGSMRSPAAPVLRPGDVNTFTGARGVTQAVAPAANPVAVQRPAFTAPSIAPIGSPGVTAQSESTDQRRAREAAISEIGSQLFQLRGKNTRSARDATTDLVRTQADLTNVAGNQSVALKNNNLDQQTRADMLGLQQNAENNRAVLGEGGANERLAYHEAGDTERERLKLERPEIVSDREGRYVAVDATRGVARPVMQDGQPLLAGQPEGSITPVARLASLQEELKAQEESLSPDPARRGVLQQQIDAIRSGKPAQLETARPTSYQEFFVRAKALNPSASDAELRAYYDKTYGGERVRGVP